MSKDLKIFRRDLSRRFKHQKTNKDNEKINGFIWFNTFELREDANKTIKNNSLRYITVDMLESNSKYILFILYKNLTII